MTDEDMLIAEFMDLKLYKELIRLDDFGERASYEEEKVSNVWVENPLPEFDNHKRIYSYYYDDRDLEKPYKNYYYSLNYSKSWDWLMPVWRKVIDIIGLSMQLHYDINISKLWMEKSHEITSAISDEVNIEKAYSRIAQIINWYNKNK